MTAPSARDLLDGVDAMMRRNRAAEAARDAALRAGSGIDMPADDDIPVLTEVVGIDEPAGDGADVPLLTEAIGDTEVVRMLSGAEARHDHGVALDDPSILPGAAATEPEISAAPDYAFDGSREHDAVHDVGQLSGSDTVEVIDAGAHVAAAPHADAVVPDLASAPLVHQTPAPQEASPRATDADDPHWNMLAEQIRTEVLQSLALMSDGVVQRELARQLQPIVDRASAELVASIHREAGNILRDYVAQAVERAIEQRRRAGH